MPNFCVNTGAPRNPNRNHEVHNKTKGCVWMPLPKNQRDIGLHSNCHGAVALAQKTFKDADGCATCCPDCNNE